MTVVLPTDPCRPDPDVIERAVDALMAGEVVGVPTDTVYGIAADPSRPGATDRIFAVKDRPRDVALPVLVADVGQAEGLVAAPSEAASLLMARWWPGPLTVVMACRPGAAADLGGDMTTVGVRCPDHEVPRSLCRRVGPLATTSANRHGAAPVTSAAELAAGLPGVAVVVDAGVCDRPPSTVVDCSRGSARLLRPGAVPWADLVASLGELY